MTIFVDTSAWVALENKKDIHYKQAITFKDEIKNKSYRLYTSSFVLDETYTLLLANIGYEKTIDYARRLRIVRETKDCLPLYRLQKRQRGVRMAYIREI